MEAVVAHDVDEDLAVDVGDEDHNDGEYVHCTYIVAAAINKEAALIARDTRERYARHLDVNDWVHGEYPVQGLVHGQHEPL